MNTRIQKAVNFIESVVGELTDAQRNAIKGEIEGVALFSNLLSTNDRMVIEEITGGITNEPESE